jgi:hypothetical protein
MAQPPLQIAGYQVSFPYRPYGTQLGFMNQFLRCVDQQGNALLEAPTGSGKTACLLASALAWQRRHIEAAAAARSRRLERALARSRNGKLGFGGGGGPEGAAKAPAPAAEGKAPAAGGGEGGAGAEGAAEGKAAAEGACGGGEDEIVDADAKGDKQEEADAEEEEEEIPKVPKIYYATRTHSQIAQARGAAAAAGAGAGVGPRATRVPGQQRRASRARRTRLLHVPARELLGSTARCRRPPTCPQVIRELKRMGLHPRMAVLVGGWRT